MVSKAKSVKGSAKGVAYIQSDKELGDAVELDRNGIVSKEPNEILNEFRLVQESNVRCDKNTISIVISPSDERKFTDTELRNIGKKHLQELGLKDHQYLMTKHESTGKPHIHILANRIDENGKALNDSMISKRCQEISQRIAVELKLRTAKDIQAANEIALQPIKLEIKSAHDFAVKNSKTFDDYKDLMHSKGCKVLETINKKGDLQGFRILHKESGLDFKASEINKSVGLKNLIQNKVQLPTNIIPSLQNIAFKVAKTIIQEASKGMGIGF